MFLSMKYIVSMEFLQMHGRQQSYHAAKFVSVTACATGKYVAVGT